MANKRTNILDSLKLDQAFRFAQRKMADGFADEAMAICDDILTKFPQNNRAKELRKELSLANKPSVTAPAEPEKEQLSLLITKFNSGELEQAADQAQVLLQEYPLSLTLYNIIGASNSRLKKYDLAIASYKKAISIRPSYAEAHNNMGIALKESGDLDAAIEAYNQALKSKPDYAEACYNKGIALQEKRDLSSATESYQQAININPNYSEAYNNLGNIHQDRGEWEDAISNFEMATKINSKYTAAYRNLGLALYRTNHFSAAVESLMRAIELNPHYTESYFNLGLIYQSMGKSLEAISAFNDALVLNADHEAARVSKLHQQSQLCDWSGISEDSALIPTLGISDQYVDLLGLFAVEDAPERHLMRAKVYSKGKYKQKPRPLNAKAVQKPDRIRIGYFSADFREHPVSFLLARTLECHNHDKFEIHAYSYGPNDQSQIRDRITAAVDKFNDVKGWSNLEVVDKVRTDKIDIAIDLTGYTKSNRTELFAYRLAPIQMNYLGFEGTMGADFIDYIVSDHTCIPEEAQKYYKEKIIYLPNAYMPTDDFEAPFDQNLTRAEFGLPDAALVFCCFNACYKITSAEFDIWVRVMLKVPGSVLWLRRFNVSAENNLRAEAVKRGLNPDRIVFADRADSAVHIARHGLADLFLDTFSMNAHATAIDALRGGLPIISKLGKGFMARVGASFLNALDLPELVAADETDYERLMLDLALNPDRLAHLKAKLEKNCLSAPLFDTQLYTKNFEDGLQQAYDLYFREKNPQNIEVGKNVI